ncbi:MAG: hypothetical protein JEZ05_00155 [Tenericutes bacterium]|nr:hypothetical protein [Mycoplasmatota bacterium]
MKKLKARLSKAKSFLSVKTYKHPRIFVIGTMLLINIVILGVAALIALGIDDSFDSFLDAFANGSLKWMLTPNAILQIDNPRTLFLAVVVLVTGMILFTGTIIALTTNAIKDYFQKKKSGSGKIHLDNHIVILNWNNKVPELVADLLYVDEKGLEVVILADINKEYAEKQIINALNQEKFNEKEISSLNVMVKPGDPLLYTELDDISIERAKSLLIMNKDMPESVIKGLSKSDLNVIKVILNIGRVDFIYDPPIVAEIKRIETKDKIETMSRVVKSLHEHMIMPICFDRRLGQIIAQTIINPCMEDIYLSLFSFEDSEIYHLKDKTFDKCLLENSEAIPVSIKGKDLFVLSLTNKTKSIIKKKEYEIIDIKIGKVKQIDNLDVFIVGTNNKLKFIMDSFLEYEKLYNNEFKALYVEEKNLKAMVKQLNESDKKSTIVLLSDELQELDSLDANVIDNLIYLQGNIKNDNVNIIVELLDPKNDHIIKDFDIDNTIISNKIISLLLSKLALYKETASFYENLLTMKSDVTGKDDQNIFIVKASEIIKDSLPLHFSSIKQFIISLYTSTKKVYIPLGIIREKSIKIFSGDMTESKEFLIKKLDQIVLIKI